MLTYVHDSEPRSAIGSGTNQAIREPEHRCATLVQLGCEAALAVTSDFKTRHSQQIQHSSERHLRDTGLAKKWILALPRRGWRRHKPCLHMVSRRTWLKPCSKRRASDRRRGPARAACMPTPCIVFKSGEKSTTAQKRTHGQTDMVAFAPGSHHHDELDDHCNRRTNSYASSI